MATGNQKNPASDSEDKELSRPEDSCYSTQQRRSTRIHKTNKLCENDSQTQKHIINIKKSSTSIENRPYDKLADGTPFSCDICKSRFVCNPRNRGKTTKRSRHMPAPRQKYDERTGLWLLLCNACGLALNRPRRVCKVKITPSDSAKNAHFSEVKSFLSSLAVQLNDTDVEKFYCPVFKMAACDCLQKFITSSADGGETPLDRTRNLLTLHKTAQKLRQEKCYTLDKNSFRPSHIGLGNGKKRSQAFEQFVLEKRAYLRDTCKLCERATQRMLIYSNNFLHKKLKTADKKCRVTRVKGKAALGQLPNFSDLYDVRCCSNNCVLMVRTHTALLNEWRTRATAGQAEARRVLAEMLTPTAGGRSNCYKFVSWVSGCSHSTICRVNDQMRATGGVREPPAHALKKARDNKDLTPDVNDILTNPASMEMRRSELVQLQERLRKQQKKLQEEQDFIEQRLNAALPQEDSVQMQQTPPLAEPMAMQGQFHPVQTIGGNINQDLSGQALIVPQVHNTAHIQMLSSIRTDVPGQALSAPQTLSNTPLANFDEPRLLTNDIAQSIAPGYYFVEPLAENVQQPVFVVLEVGPDFQSDLSEQQKST